MNFMPVTSDPETLQFLAEDRGTRPPLSSRLFPRYRAAAVFAVINSKRLRVHTASMIERFALLWPPMDAPGRQVRNFMEHYHRGNTSRRMWHETAAARGKIIYGQTRHPWIYVGQRLLFTGRGCSRLSMYYSIVPAFNFLHKAHISVD